MLQDPFENAIAFFLICGIVFFEDISLFHSSRFFTVFAISVLVVSSVVLGKDHPGIALLCAILLLLLLARNTTSKIVVH
jgi:hypothetical protein